MTGALLAKRGERAISRGARHEREARDEGKGEIKRHAGYSVLGSWKPDTVKWNKNWDPWVFSKNITIAGKSSICEQSSAWGELSMEY